MSSLLGIVWLDSRSTPKADALAKRLNKPLFDSEQGFFLACEKRLPGLALVHDGQRLELRAYDERHKQPMGGVFAETGNADIQRRILAGRKQPFARSLGLNRRSGLRVLDATAGLGRDSFVMAGLGCKVSLLERNPIVHALLEDAVQALADQPDKHCQLQDCQDAADYLANLPVQAEAVFDVIYLDPMYPEQDRKALPKKEMQLIRQVSGDDADADALLALALRVAKRVVVKRSPHAGDMAAQAPAYRVTGKSVRYDVYLAAPQNMDKD